jgi:hypothetical protein
MKKKEMGIRKRENQFVEETFLLFAIFCQMYVCLSENDIRNQGRPAIT